MRALSIRQPHIEAILRGVKKIEYRSIRTNIRERVYLYASLGRYADDVEAEMLANYRIRDVRADELRERINPINERRRWTDFPNSPGQPEVVSTQCAT
jgi:hypothetical protein